MYTRYVSPEKFSKVSKCKKVVYYPNPWIKDEDYAKETKEMFGDEDARVFVLECEWFPTELVAGVVNGKFSNTSSLSRKTGWLRTFGVIELFRAEKVEEAISILNKHGFKFDKAQLHKQV